MLKVDESMSHGKEKKFGTKEEKTNNTQPKKKVK